MCPSPPHPSPLPWGEGALAPALEKARRPVMNPGRPIAVPSPRGKGQGEKAPSEVAHCPLEPGKDAFHRVPIALHDQGRGGTRPYRTDEVHGKGEQPVQLHRHGQDTTNGRQECRRSLHALGCLRACAQPAGLADGSRCVVAGHRGAATTGWLAAGQSRLSRRCLRSSGRLTLLSQASAAARSDWSHWRARFSIWLLRMFGSVRVSAQGAASSGAE